MQKVFGETTFEPSEKRRDKELTLGPTTLILLGLGLFALCGVCFIFGYAVGQHGSPVTPRASTSASAINAETTPQTAATPAKPAPSQNSFQPRQSTPTPAIDAANDTSSTQNPVQQKQSAPPPTPSTLSSTPPPAPSTKSPSASLVQAALPGTQATASSGPVVKPALPSSTTQPAAEAGTWMVQIAAVSHTEDADVLVSALRKHSYAVFVHRDPVDGLIHVQVGPFASHSDAVVMRQKLLNDGYNAIVQP